MMAETYFAQLDAIPDGPLLVDVTLKPPWFLSRDQRARLQRRPELAPSEALLSDFMAAKAELKQRGVPDTDAHNRAFADVSYRERFFQQVRHDDDARRTLAHLAETSRRRDVYLVCYCAADKACHRHLLIEWAQSWLTDRDANDVETGRE
jgi:uncharacterized protein YeaO (DUF488 family)